MPQIPVSRNAQLHLYVKKKTNNNGIEYKNFLKSLKQQQKQPLKIFNSYYSC